MDALTAPSAERDLETLWEVRGLTTADLLPDTDGTIAHRAAREDTVAAVPAPHDEPNAPAGRVTLGPVLAEGGMGVVHLAHQPALKREVAAKVLRADRREPEGVAALLREAWVTGALEHPNIVPVHLLEVGRGTPVMVMKRIEGTAWSELLREPARVAALHPGDPFEWHLRVLMTVCHAVHFAHSRGVLHLDLKPANVMVGRYGEVYLVDWGIAASLAPHGPEWLPRARDIASVCGTPASMAPEQAAADGERLGVATDVYGLGAILHELVTGSPPHRGVDLRATLVAAYRSDPAVYAPAVPAELVAILRCAMARDPAERHPSAEDLRRALEDFLGHRASTALADLAARQLAALRARLAQVPPGPAELGPALARDFTECRLAFRQALALWPGSPAARAGLAALLGDVADHALAHDDPARAAECLAELEPPDPARAARLAALEARLAAEEARLRGLERDADPNLFHRDRSLLAAISSLAWLLWNGACGVLHRTEVLVFGFSELVLMNLANFSLFITAMVMTRRTLLTTATNRRGVLLFGAGFLTVLLFWISAHIAGVDPILALSLSTFVYVYFLLAIALVIDRRAAWGVLPLVPLALASAAWPTYAFELAGLTGFATGAFLAYIWRRPRATA